MTTASSRYSILPVQHPALWEAFLQHHNNFWSIKDVDFSQDIPQIKLIVGNERHFLVHTFAFFNQSDGIIGENLASRFIQDVLESEARAFFYDQMQRELVHSWCYSLMIDTWVPDAAEKERLFHAIEHIPAVKRKAEWAQIWLNSEASFVHRLVAFAIVEGIFFASSFCSIFWFRKRGLLPGLAVANNWIARDEGMHWQFLILYYKTILQPKGIVVQKAELYQIMGEAVSIEKEFALDALPVNMIGMNADLMCQYIEYQADIVIKNFGFPPLYNATNPFDFMVMNDLESKTNFFEKRVDQYQAAYTEKLTYEADF